MNTESDFSKSISPDRFFMVLSFKAGLAKNPPDHFPFGRRISPHGKQPLEKEGGFASIDSVSARQALRAPRLQVHQGFDKGGD
jgi:hypothetical protein